MVYLIFRCSPAMAALSTFKELENFMLPLSPVFTVCAFLRL